MNIIDSSCRRIVIAVLILIAFLCLIPVAYHYLAFADLSPTEQAIQQKLARESENFSHLEFNLSDPTLAPPALHDTVMLGYHIMIDTAKYAPGYAGDKLSCTNCHFGGGNTTGGTNGSISLAGVAATYPSYNKKFDRVITLEERINSCFERSLNSKPLPADSKEMVALVAYIHWISKKFPIYDIVPWRGLKALHSNPNPDPRRGAQLWESRCALCHGTEGEGKPGVPPIWGDNSFNDAAGMYNLDTMAAFIHANMPYQEPSLTEEEALDVAAFIRTRPRPHYTEGDSNFGF